MRRLRELVARPEDDLDLAEGALVIAAEEYPDLDVTAWLGRLDQMARELNARLPEDRSADALIAALNRFLFDTQGFSGNGADYYDPRNSYINEVLERRTGIPISLSIVYMELGRRIGLPLEGVSFPGHFLVACPVPGGTLVLDPYSRGISLGREDLERRLEQLYGAQVLERVDLADLLQPAAKRDILARLLRNLKSVYLRAGDLPRGLSAIERILAIDPDNASELRDRGLVFRKLECFRGALDDLQRYLALEPEAGDVDEIRARIVDLKNRVSSLN